MNNERTVVLENVSDQPVGLKDTQNRTYRFGVGGKVRISEISLQDILDYPASRIIFNEGMIAISNITADKLYEMGLTEKEIKKYLGDNYTEEVAEEEPEVKEEEPETFVGYTQVIEEPKEEPEIKKEKETPAPATKKATTRKTNTKKKTTSSRKTK